MRNWLLLTKVLMKTGANGLSSGIGGTSKKRSPAVTVLLYVIIGLCLIPLLPVLIKDYESFAALQINAVLIFVLFLLRIYFSFFRCMRCS